MTHSENCPCGSEKDYQICCEPLHKGKANAKTAEQLMRSRYAAYSKGLVDYLIQTLHPSKRNSTDRQALQNAVSNSEWLRLEIHAVEGGSINDDQGFVEFSAYYQEEQFGILREKSRFLKEDGQWFYVDGEFKKPQLPGRNDPCWCGSNRKYKKCHGK